MGFLDVVGSILFIWFVLTVVVAVWDRRTGYKPERCTCGRVFRSKTYPVCSHCGGVAYFE